jgi:Leucine-rich repeat (LRR) protein
MICRTCLAFLLFCFSFFYSFNTSGQSEGNVPDAVEYQALKDLFTNCNGANWTNKNNWPGVWPATVANTVFGAWFGVSVANGDITSISLSANNLTGAIPESLGNLFKIVAVDLGGNQLTSIPSSIGNLSSLQTLVLYYNQISTSIPSSIGNNISLRQIWFNNNHITGPIPPSIGNLVNLQVLRLESNALSGSLPLSFASLAELGDLNLSNNSLSGALPDLSSCSKLTALNLMNNLLSGTIPSSITQCNSLAFLNLGGNHFSGSIPASLGNLTKLISLALNGNSLTGPIPISVGSLVHLNYLNIKDNQLTSDLPSSMINLNKLIKIDLSNNQLSGDLSFVSNQINLSELMIDHNLFSGAFPGVTSLSQLNFLGAHNNKFQSVPSSILSLPILGSVYFNENEIESIPDFSHHVNKQNLRLNLTNNKLTHEDLSFINNGSNGILSINYYPQLKIDVAKNLNAFTGSPLSLTTTIDRNTPGSSIYQWFKVVNGISSALNTPSSSSHSFTVQSISQADEGTKYYYTITNPASPGLILTSELQTLQITTCNLPTLDFQFAQENNTHTFTPSITQADGCTVTYSWDFGDGETSTDQVASHTYNTTGTYVAKLTLNYTCGNCPASTKVKEYPVEITNTSICNSIYCDGLGGVGIGTRKTQGFRLSVEGKIRASDIVKVYPKGQWSDFVFAKNYKLRPLSEVESFIKINGHLPEIPSAAEVEKDGVELGSMDAKLLQKIEELTLYMIESTKRDEAIGKKMKELEIENQLLKKDIQKLKINSPKNNPNK